jgi:hypothetical protein
VSVARKDKITFNGRVYRVVGVREWPGMEHLLGDHLLTSTCSWQAYTGVTEDGSYDVTEGFATAATLACMCDQPNAEWRTGYPDVDFSESIILWLPANAGGMCQSVLCERIQGVTA